MLLTVPEIDRTPNSDALDALDAFLLSDRAPPQSMGVSELDGFLTGLVIGPETVPLSEWLPVVWRGQQPSFDTPEESRTVLAAMMRRYDAIARRLDAEPEVFEPSSLEQEDGPANAEQWARGFGKAVSLRLGAWEPLFHDRTARKLLALIMIPAKDENGTPFLPLDFVTDATTLKLARHVIPVAVVGLRQFWRSHDLHRSPPLRTGPKVGRNDPCPCGSGQKYKRCCGDD
jgi:uncharacterized protein